MKTYELNLFGVKRELPFIDLEGDMAFASFVIMGDTELIAACAPELAERIGDVDVILSLIHICMWRRITCLYQRKISTRCTRSFWDSLQA